MIVSTCDGQCFNSDSKWEMPVYIIIYLSSIHKHISTHTEVFKRLRQTNLKFLPEKCEFLCKEVAYLDHIITGKAL